MFPQWDRVMVREGTRRQHSWTGVREGGKVVVDEAGEVEVGTVHTGSHGPLEELSLLL